MKQNLVQAFREGSVSRALKVLKRNTAVMDLMVKQINLLSTLTPVEFAGFRDELRPASGFQSMQFREFEFAYGLRDDFFLKFFPQDSPMRECLEKRQQQPSVYDEFLACLDRAGFKMPPAVLQRDVTRTHEASDAVRKVIQRVYENPEDNYHWVLLFEALVDFDENLLRWRATHILMVARTIGSKRGTGGSSGYQFLEKRLHYRFFPELWDVRSHVGSDY